MITIKTYSSFKRFMLLLLNFQMTILICGDSNIFLIIISFFFFFRFCSHLLSYFAYGHTDRKWTLQPFVLYLFNVMAGVHSNWAPLSWLQPENIPSWNLSAITWPIYFSTRNRITSDNEWRLLLPLLYIYINKT